jgi:subtilase family serine protease
VGTGSQLHSSGRWGDYSTLVVDPVDDCTFWYTQQYYAVTSQTGWQTRIGAFAFPGCQGSSSTLPAVRVTATTPGAAEAGPTNGLFTVARTGDTALPLTVSFTTGGTAVPGADYVALGGDVAIAAGNESATIVLTPVDDATVEPNETVVVTLTPNPAYLIGSSGAAVTIVSDDAPADLVVTAVSNASTGGGGGSITVTDTTKNQGAGPAETSSTGFYLSANLNVDAADVSLGSRVVPALAAATSSSVSTVLQIPLSMPTGAYYVLAKADAAGAITELLETNNTRVGILIKVGPDLVVSALTVPATAIAGGPMNVSDTTTNLGAGSAAASATSFYLSINLALDAADVLLGSRPVGSLAPSTAEPASTVVTIPAGTPAAVYFVLAKADGAAAVVETQETNNVKFSGSIGIGPDLVESSIAIPAVGGAGIAVSVLDTVRNMGTGQAGASVTAFYLSMNSILDSADVPLGTRNAPALAGAETHQATTSLQIPAGTITGTYILLVKADANNDVNEVRETNNVTYSTIRIGADLTVSAIAVPGTAAAGATVTATDTVKNIGGGAAPGSTTRFYLSANLSLDASDVRVGSRAVAELAPGAVDAGPAALAIPAQTTAGTYFIIAVADGETAVSETLESNNTRSGGIRITIAAPVSTEAPGFE